MQKTEVFVVLAGVALIGFGLASLNGRPPKSASNPRAAAQTDCGTMALTEYTRKNLALLTSSGPVMSVEATVAQRRLTEQFCVRFTRCLFPNPEADAAHQIEFQSAFSTCIDDEEEERRK